MVISTFIASMVGKDRPAAEFHLKVTSEGVVSRLPLGEQPVTIGRAQDNLIPLKDHKASRNHCVIERSGDGWRLRDLESSNGTQVNGTKVTTVALVAGDVIQIGKVRMRLIAGPVPAPGKAEDDSAPARDAVDPLAELVDEASADPAAAPAAEPPTRAKAVTRRGPAREPLSPPSLADLDEDPADGDTPDGWPDGGRAASNTIVSAPSAPLHEQELEQSARALPGAGFAENRIALLGPKSNVVHEVRPNGRRTEARDPVDLWRLVLLIAFRARGSDIHLEPKQEHALVRVRVDGAMVDVARLPKELGQRLGSLVKVLAEIDIQHRDTIQEGQFSADFPPGTRDEAGRRIAYRVSFAPTVHGQKLVLRILDAASGPQTVHDLGLPQAVEKTLTSAIRRDQGLVLVCGPTGSGKSSTLTSLVRTIDCTRRNVVTIEDPVEIQLEGVSQIEVDEEAGKGFAPLLRSLLRQDPDVLLVGEIRDPETARTAMQAAMTGHLLLSSIHAQDAVGTIHRLLDLGSEPFQIAQALQVVVAQRLVRRLCTNCREAGTPTAEEQERLGPAGRGLTTIHRPVGCPACLGTGYLGRVAVFELLTISDGLRAAIHARAGADEMRAALPPTFIDLRRSGLSLVAKGITSLNEIDEALGGE